MLTGGEPAALPGIDELARLAEDAVIVSTDSERYAAIAQHYGAEVPGLRPAAILNALRLT